MSAATTERPAPRVTPLTRDELQTRLVAAIADRDHGMALAEDSATDWDKNLIDQAIAWFAQTGTPFSANDVREALPEDINCRGLMGNRFTHAWKTHELIEPVGWLPSSKRNTHGKPVGQWIGADFVDQNDRQLG